MTEKQVALLHGWKVGDSPAKQVVVGFPTAGDLLDAEAQPGDLARGLFLLARRIKSVDGRDLAVTLEMLRSLPAPDLERLSAAADALDREAGSADGSLGKLS